MYDVHFGLTAATFENRHHLGLANASSMGTDLDGWNSWGEPVGTDTNDSETLHVIVQCDTVGEAIDTALSLAIAWEFEDAPFVPSTGAQPDNVISVTEHADWSVQYLLVTTLEARFIANPVALP